MRLTGKSTGGGTRSGRESLRSGVKAVLTSSIVEVRGEIHRSVSPVLRLRIEDWQDPLRIRIERINPEFTESVDRGKNGGGVPVDLRALRLVGKDSLTWDLLVFLAWRIRGLKQPLVLEWSWLSEQLGSAISNPYAFRARLRDSLSKARILYPGLKAEVVKRGIEISPSPPWLRFRA